MEIRFTPWRMWQVTNGLKVMSIFFRSLEPSSVFSLFLLTLFSTCPILLLIPGFSIHLSKSFNTAPKCANNKWNNNNFIHVLIFFSGLHIFRFFLIFWLIENLTTPLRQLFCICFTPSSTTTMSQSNPSHGRVELNIEIPQSFDISIPFNSLRSMFAPHVFFLNQVLFTTPSEHFLQWYHALSYLLDGPVS